MPSCVIVVNSDKYKKIADDYLECDSHVVQGSRFHANLLKSLRNVKKRAIIYWMVLVGNGVLYLMKPIVMSGRNLPENYYVIYGKVFSYRDGKEVALALR